MIRASRLSFAYKHTNILDGMDFAVRPSEIFGIIGPNGSGKTTLLKILSGLLRPYRGEVEISGKNLSQYTPRELARKIAVVPQETHVAFPFTALEIVLMGRAPYLRGMSLEDLEDLELARKAMEWTDTLPLATRSIQELSGGEKQRVIVARALAQQADLLVLDEPTAFLDIRHQVEMCELLKRLNRDQGRTIVVVFHDLNLASMYCHRLLLLNQGRIYRLGSPLEVVTYANIKAVYGAEVYVGINDLTGLPYYTPMQPHEKSEGALP
jgi:iron complex transport system ATP-binding protein